MSRPLLLKDPYSQTPPLNGAHSLFTAEGDTHRRIRAVLINSFSDKALRSQAPIIEKYANQLISRIQREANDSDDGAVDLTKLYGYATFDTITDLSLGEALVKGLEDANEHGWVKNYFFHAKFSAIRTALSRFSPLNTILGLFLLGMTRKARQRNWGVITGALDRRLARNDSGEMSVKRSDLLTALEDRLDESATKGITKAEMTSNGLAFVLAGTQLNTNVLSTATYLLLRERSTWEHLVKEVRTKFSSDSEITVLSTQNLPYLEAVINETIRIRHPTPINLPRVVSGAGCVLNNEVLPRNVNHSTQGYCDLMLTLPRL
jgi:cytochrome P450